MIAAEAVAVVLLAAGQSRRFGTRDKLAEPLNGLPLGLHAARTLSMLPFASRLAVTGREAPDFASYGFKTVINPDPAAGQAGSLRLGLAEARRGRSEAVLIALADMPFVSARHLEALLSRFDQDHLVVGSSFGETACPPVLFDASHFEALEALAGDQGARTLLRGATLIAASALELADVDTVDDLASLQRPAG